MCGIFGYIGKKDSITACLKGLELVEYRGYDSSGIAGLHKGNLFFCKEVGNIAKLKKKLLPQKVTLDIAIAHTRWASHGEPSEKNAHPHTDTNKTLALIHNGIIENHDILRKNLQKEGVCFTSDTDTEVVAQLIAHHYKNDLLNAVILSLQQLKGSFAFALIHKDFPNQILAVAKDNPLVIGHNDDKTELLLSSDPNAFLGYDLNVFYLREGEIALLSPQNIKVYDFKAVSILKKLQKFEGKNKLPSKEGFEHFMLKEIFEQPKTIQNAISSVNWENFGISPLLSHLKTIDHILITACGTSWHAACIAAHFFQEMLGIFTQVEIASELRSKRLLLPDKKTLAIAISQSGETADTLASVRYLKENGAKVLGICNVPNSTLTRESDGCIFLSAGPEMSVCSTKAFTSQVTLLFLFTLFLGTLRKSISKEEKNHFLDELKNIPEKLQKVLNQAPLLQKIAKRYNAYQHFFFLGKNLMYPTSQEAALKLKEISYINATAYPSGELKHGPIALLDKNYPTIAFCSNKKTEEKLLSNLMEVKARKSPLLCFAPDDLPRFKEIADDLFELPSTIDELSIFPSTVAGQLFAYFIAKERNTEIDQPRNLAKSVTVE